MTEHEQRHHTIRVGLLRRAAADQAALETLCAVDAMLRMLGHAEAADALIEQRYRVLHRAIARVDASYNAHTTKEEP